MNGKKKGQNINDLSFGSSDFFNVIWCFQCMPGLIVNIGEVWLPFMMAS